jgi:hypothetical protein
MPLLALHDARKLTPEPFPFLLKLMKAKKL